MRERGMLFWTGAIEKTELPHIEMGRMKERGHQEVRLVVLTLRRLLDVQVETLSRLLDM